MKVNKNYKINFLFVATFFVVLFIIISIILLKLKLNKTNYITTDNSNNNNTNNTNNTNEHFGSSKCYSCEKQTCNSEYPTKCFDCQIKQAFQTESTIDYLMKFPMSTPMMTYL